MTVDISTRIKNARHEVDCRECRVTWRSLVARLVGVNRGYTPWVRPSRRANRRAETDR